MISAFAMVVGSLLRVFGANNAIFLIIWQVLAVFVQAIWWFISSGLFKEQHIGRSVILVAYVQIYFSVGASLLVTRLDVTSLEFWFGIAGVLSIEMYRDSYLWFHYQKFVDNWITAKREISGTKKLKNGIGIFHWNMQAGRIERLSIFASAGVLLAEWQLCDSNTVIPSTHQNEGKPVFQIDFLLQGKEQGYAKSAFLSLIIYTIFETLQYFTCEIWNRGTLAQNLTKALSEILLQDMGAEEKALASSTAPVECKTSIPLDASKLGVAPHNQKDFTARLQVLTNSGFPKPPKCTTNDEMNSSSPSNTGGGLVKSMMQLTRPRSSIGTLTTLNSSYQKDKSVKASALITMVHSKKNEGGKW